MTAPPTLRVARGASGRELMKHPVYVAGIVAALITTTTLWLSLLGCDSSKTCEQSCSASYECGPGLSCFGGRCLPSSCSRCASSCNYNNVEGACEFVECR